MVGDPGFFGSLFGIGKRLARGAVGFATGGPGGAIRGIAAGQPPRARGGSFVPPQKVIRGTSIRQRIEQIVPGGATGLVVDPVTGEMRRKRRRMNVGNAKALRRSIRRVDGFVRLSRSALKNTGFKIVSKSSGKVSRATMDKAVAAAHHAGK